VAVLDPGRVGAQPPQFSSSPPSPSFVATYNFFAKITQISDIFVFPKFRKVGKFAASIERPKIKMLQLQGGGASELQGASPSDPVTRGSALGPHWGLCPRSPLLARASAFAMGPCPQIL